MAEERLSVNAPNKAAAFSNCLFVGPTDKLGNSAFVETNGYVFNVRRHEEVADGTIALNSVQRKVLKIDDGEKLAVQRFKPPPDLPSIGMVYAEVRRVKDSKQALELQADAVIKKVLDSFLDQIFTVHQEVTFELQGANLKIVITQLVVDQAGQAKEVARGYLRGNTAFILVNGGSNAIKIAGQKGFASTQLFKTKKINFTDLGIGGLDRQFEAIFRRAFASRTFAPSILQRMGLKHVKGMLLYGPPGTGKTLIARQIGKMLNGKEPKVVNGPEILNKFVGASEENIRNLFADADAEYKEKGDESDLHIIIFDEIDAICKQRGSVQGGSGVHDTVVNQLLTKMDGVDALNNILIIGMTNRKDMLDEALLRPGRLEVHVEVGLPDEAGRLQILQIHTNKMSENSFLARDVDLAVLAERTKNFSGAELEGLVKDASAFALNRNVDFNDLSKAIDETNIKVTMQDFEHSLEEVKAAFGASTETLLSYAVHGIIDSGETSQKLLQTLRTLVSQVRNSDKTPLLSCVLEGPTGSGKSALAASVAKESDFPFIKVITSETMVGFAEQAKCQQIARVFDDAYKSPLSIIILDDIERLLEYVAIGPRFSNVILQALLVLVKRPPPAGRRLLIIGTTSSGEVIESMGMSDVFNVSLHVPSLRTDELVRVLNKLEIFEVKDIPMAVEELSMVTGKNLSVPIKKLLLWVEMAKQGVKPGHRISLDQWATVLRDLS